MAVVNVTSRAGKTYQFEIAGPQPSAHEKAWIDQYVAQQEQPAQTEAPQDGGGFMNAIGMGVDQMQQAFGSALEGGARSVGLDSIADYGRSVADFNEGQVNEASQGMTQWDDVNGVGDFAKYGVEQIGQQVPNYGSTWAARLAGAYGGGVAGSMFGPVGTGIGALIGGIAAPYAVNTAQMYGGNRERQRQEDIAAGRAVEVDEGAAAASALRQGVADTAGELIPFAKFMPKPLANIMTSGGVATRIAKGIGFTVAAEVPIEVYQQVEERYQAGLPLTDEAAMKEYADIARATAISAGAVGGVTNAFNPDSKRIIRDQEDAKKQKEMFEDAQEDEAATKEAMGFANQPDPTAELNQPKAPAPLGLPAPVGAAGNAVDGQSTAAGTSTTTNGQSAPAAAPTRPFQWSQYQAAVAKIIADGKVSIPAIQQAAKMDAKSIVSPDTARSIKDEMERQGIIKPKGKNTYEINQQAAAVDPMESYRRTIEDMDRREAEAKARRAKAMEDARREAQTGSKQKARDILRQADAADEEISIAQKTRDAIQQRMASLPQDQQVQTREAVQPRQQSVEFQDAPRPVQEREVASRMDRMASNLQLREQGVRDMERQVAELQRAGKKVQLPKSEQARLADLKSQLAASKKEITALRSKMRNPDAIVAAAQQAQAEKLKAQQDAAVAQEVARKARVAQMTPAYTVKQQEVFSRLRERLNAMNLKDVSLKGEKAIQPAPDALAEGTFDMTPDNKAIIALSMGIYDPNLTEDQLFQRLASVMNHEVIHALKAMGLMTDGEWQTLVEVAKRQSYVKDKNGVPTKRSYTYHERAASMYGGQDAGIIDEEAVAELFRDWVNGKVKIGGKPRSLMERIKDFFRAMWGSHKDSGIDSVDRIFEDIQSGKMGLRDRVAPSSEMSPDQADRMRYAVKSLLAMKVREGEKGLYPIPSPVKDANGNPSVEYGVIWEGDDPIPVIFPQGSHNFAAKAGFGMKHIMARNHDRELFENSKYKSVQNAVFDILYRWKKQDFADDGDIHGYNYDGNITLDWVNNRTHSAPLLRLALARYEFPDPKGNPVKVYGVKTFFPVDPKKKLNVNTKYSLLRHPMEVDADGISKPQENGPVWTDQAGVPIDAEGADGEALRASAKKFAARTDPSKPEYGQLTVADLDNLTPEFFDKQGWAILTATSERDWQEERFREQANRDAHQRLVEELESKGIPYRKVEGMYMGVPDGTSYLILADEATARNIGARYDQDSVLTNRGLVFSQADLPRMIRNEGIFYGDEAKAKDFWTDLGDGKAFSLDLDWGSGPSTPDIGIGFYEDPNRPQLPIRRSDGKVELHHWSHLKLDTVDPAYRGTGPLKNIDRGLKNKVFFGIMPRPDDLAQGTGYVKETALGPNEHIALFDPQALYPYFTDPDNLAAGLEKNPNAEMIYEQRIRDAGYKGYYTERIDGRNPAIGRVKPWTAKLGNVAVVFEAVPVRPASEVQLGLRNPTRYSMMRGMTRPLNKSERKLTVLNRMDENNDYRFVPNLDAKGKPVKRSVLEAAQTLFNERGRVAIEEDDPDFIVKIARLMLAEARAALKRNPNAIGWYGDKVKLAKQVAAMLHPEISPVHPITGAPSNSYDIEAEHAWDYAMAVTSNGMAVTQNAKEANSQFEYWKDQREKTGRGRFKEVGTGKQGVGMEAAFRFYNAMVDAGLSDAQIMDFLSHETTPKELKSHPIVKAVGLKVSGSESATAKVYGSYVIGPKIGNGFYQNLRGNFEPLTMDLWFMRMFNRLTGHPFVEVSDELLKKNAQRVAAAFKDRENWTQYERDTAAAVLRDLGIDFLTEKNIEDFSTLYDEVFQRDFKKWYDDAIKASGLDPKSDEAKAIGKAARPVGGELTDAAKRHHVNLLEKTDEAPRGSGQRALMRRVVDQVRAAMANIDGVSINTADFQALMWYAEKQLMASMGVREGNGGDNDYVDGAIELLRSKGMTDDQIARGLPDTERDRLSHRSDAKRTAARVRENASGAVEGGGGTGDVSAAPVTGGQAAAGGDGNKGGLTRQSMMSVRRSVAPTAGQYAQAQKALMYARSADVIASVLHGKGYGLKRDTAQKFVDGVLRRFQDNMLPVGRMIQELSAKGMTITDAMDTYLKEELMHGLVGAKIAENQNKLFIPTVEAVKKLKVSPAQIDAIKKATDPLSKNGKGFISLAMDGSDSPRTVLADAFLYALHAKERNAYIEANKDKTNVSGSGMSDAEASAILQWVAGLDADNRAAFKAIADGVRAVVANTNRTRVEAGLVSQDVVDQNPYQFYVPLRGFADNDDPRIEEMEDQSGPPSRPRFGAARREDRKALGRAGYADDLLANVFTQNQSAILRGERNKVGQSFIKLLQADPNMTADYAEVLPRAPQMRAEGPNGKTMMVNDPRAYDDPRILVVKVNGKETFVKFTDPRLAGALNGRNAMPVGAAEPLVKAMSKVNRYLANINTSFNPEFVVSNLLRDLQTAGVNVNQFEKDGLSKAVLTAIPSALKGIKRAIRNGDTTGEWAKLYADFVKHGGQNATNQFNSLADEMDGIKKMLGDISDAGVHGRINKVRNGFIGKGAGSLLQFIEDYNTVVENSTRVATYKALLDKGFTPERAAQAARNVTVNFAKGGDYRRMMGAWYLFYNASIQGSFALLRGAVRSQKVRRLWMSVVAVGVLQDQLNALLSDDEDDDGKKDYDSIPSYVLEHNFILPDIFGVSERSYIAIPMPYGLNMAHNLGRAMSRAQRGEYTAGEATSTIFGTAADALNPIGGLESWANLVAPTVADPFIDIVENRDFSDKPVYKENMPFDKTPVPDSQLYWQSTSPVARWVTSQLNELTGGNSVRAGAIDLSPDVMEYWFDYITGGVGRFVQRTAELPFRLSEEGGLTDEVMGNIPFLRKVAGSVSSREDQTAYIEASKRVLMAGEELKQARETGDVQWARDTIANYQSELKMLGLVKATDTALKKVSKQKNQIIASTKIPEDKKREMIRALNERRDMLIQRANRALNTLP